MEMFEFENYCIDMMHYAMKDNSLGIVTIALSARKKNTIWIQQA